MVKFFKATTYKNDLRVNVSLEDTADYHLDMSNSLSVSMTERLAIKISMQHLYSTYTWSSTVALTSRRSPLGNTVIE